jgi:hypothetical protein
MPKRPRGWRKIEYQGDHDKPCLFCAVSIHYTRQGTGEPVGRLGRRDYWWTGDGHRCDGMRQASAQHDALLGILNSN